MKVSEEAKYLNQLTVERAKQMEELCIKMEEQSSSLSIQKIAFEDEIQRNLRTILATEGNLKASVQVLNDEDQQIVAVRCMIFFSLTFLLGWHFPSQVSWNNFNCITIGHLEQV